MFLVPEEDNLESIGRSVNSALQISKRGEDMQLFSPYEVEHEYGKLLSGISVCFPAPYMTHNSLEQSQDSCKIGYEKIIDTYAAATQHVDQGLSCTL